MIRRDQKDQEEDLTLGSGKTVPDFAKSMEDGGFLIQIVRQTLSCKIYFIDIGNQSLQLLGQY